MNRVCVSCRRELPAGAHRCGYCGSLQPPDTIRPRTAQPQGGLSPERRALLIKILIGVLVVALIGLGGATALVIAKGGSSPQQQAAVTTASPTSHTGPTTTAAPSATATAPGATATSQPTTSCSSSNNTPVTIKTLSVSGFAPDYLLSNSLSLKPTLVSQIQNGEEVTIGNGVQMNVGITLPTAPNVAPICQVSVKLVAFQPLSGNVSNVRVACDAYYNNPGGPVGGGCGGGAPSDGQTAVTFSSTQVGTIVTAPIVDASNHPVQITSTSNGVLIITTQIATPGTYTFSVGLWQNNNGPTWSNLTLQRVILNGHIDHYWDGTACTASTMQSQLPAPTNPPGEFICPGGPPQQ